MALVGGCGFSVRGEVDFRTPKSAILQKAKDSLLLEEGHLRCDPFVLHFSFNLWFELQLCAGIPVALNLSSAAMTEAWQLF